MKRKIYLLFVCALLLTGCDKYQKDTSYVTSDIYGTYKQILDASEQGYKQEISYTFNKDKSYNSVYYEEVDGKIRQNIQQKGKIFKIKHINSDITEIYLRSKDHKVTEQLYQYKNMIGFFYSIRIPNEKNFNLFIKDFISNSEGIYEDAGYAFDDKGFYHYCFNYDECVDDPNSFVKYKKKNNIIYLENPEYGYYIMFYIVDGGVFVKSYEKQ